MSASSTHVPAIGDESARDVAQVQRPARPHRLRTWVLGVAGAIVSVALLYLIGINVFLKTRLFRDLANEDPRTLHIEYEDAWSVWPLRVHAKNLTIRNRDGSIDFLLSIDHVTFSVNVADLFHKEFHAFAVRGEGVSFRMRKRLAAPEMTDERVAELPTIPDLPSPLRDPLVPPPRTDAHYGLWTAFLEDVVADPVHEIWVDTVRWSGDASVAGGFYLKPVRDVRVGPAHVEFRSGGVTVMDVPVARGLKGTLDCTVDRFDPRDKSSPLPHVSVGADLDASIPSLELADVLLEPEGIRVAGGQGDAHVTARVRHGVVQDGTDARYETNDVRVAAHDHHVAASARALFKVDGGLGHAAFGVGGVAVRHGDAKGAAFRAKRAALDLESRALGPDAFFDDPSFVASLDGGEVPELRALDAYLEGDGGVRFDGGRATLDAQASGTTRNAKGSGTLDVRDAIIQANDKRFGGSLALAAAFAHANAETGDADLSGTNLQLADVVANGSSPPWSAQVGFPRATLRMHGAPSLAASVAFGAADARPLVALIAKSSPLPGWAAGLVEGRLDGSAQVHVAPSLVLLQEMRAKVGNFGLAADYRSAGERTRGALLVKSGIVSVGVELGSNGTKVVLLDTESWFQRVEAEIARGQ